MVVLWLTFSIWMIWSMKNYAKFHDKIEVFRVILIIKELTCLVKNSSKASMKNDMLDFNVIKFFGINTYIVINFFVIFMLDESFLHQTELKLTLMGLLGVSWFCYLWMYFPWKYIWEFIEIFFVFLEVFGYLVLWSYTLPWVVLRFLLGLMFRGCFVM